jgi:hypothetical protein
VFCSESVIRCWNSVVWSELAFAAELFVLQWIFNLLLKLSCLQQISIRFWQCVCSVWIWWKIMSWNWWLQCVSVCVYVHAKIMWLCWNLMSNYVSAANLWFTVELCVCSEFVIRCWNWVICSELAFAVELFVLQCICRCQNWVVCSELAFAA